MADFEVLKKRKDFLRVAGGIKVVTSSIILQAAQILCNNETCPKVGFTATKKLGKAFTRNRTKRRLRAVVRELFPLYASKNAEYVLVGRHNTATCDFEILKRDLKYALEKIRKEIEQKNANKQNN